MICLVRLTHLAGSILSCAFKYLFPEYVVRFLLSDMVGKFILKEETMKIKLQLNILFKMNFHYENR